MSLTQSPERRDWIGDEERDGVLRSRVDSIRVLMGFSFGGREEGEAKVRGGIGICERERGRVKKKARTFLCGFFIAMQVTGCVGPSM